MSYKTFFKNACNVRNKTVSTMTTAFRWLVAPRNE